MKYNTVFYQMFDDSARKFYAENGFVCISSLVNGSALNTLHSAWTSLTDYYARDLCVERTRYLAEITQWRDVWKVKTEFFKVLENPLSGVARWGFELPGTRLLHDQIIRKSGMSGNGEVPWHQDSMYWPVDRTGCATWMSTSDVDVDCGCLEVIAGSHLQGSNAAVDFLNDSIYFDDEKITAVPAKAGDVVLMDSRVWHRTQPAAGNSERLSHVTFWVPPNTQFMPNNAPWHPLNRQVTVNEGGILNSDEFPLFGELSSELGSSVLNSPGVEKKSGGMFSARSSIEKYVQDKTGSTEQLGALLSDHDTREFLAQECGPKNDYEKNLELIDRLQITVLAFEKHGSRNVFQSVYSQFMDRFNV